jgi:hypothetical protein
MKVDRLVLKTMGLDSPKAQISGGKPRVLANALRTTRSTSALLAARFNGGDFGEIGREIVCREGLHIHFD